MASLGPSSSSACSKCRRYAREKLRRKGLDLIAANDVSAPDAGFAVDTNQVTLLSPGGAADALPLLSKEDVAHEIWDRVRQLL